MVYNNFIPTKRKTILSYKQIITLQQVKGFAESTIASIGKYVQENGIDVTDTSILQDVLGEMASQKKLRGISPSNLPDLHSAENLAEQIIECSENEGIGIIGRWDEKFPKMLRGNVKDDTGKNKPCVLLYYKGNVDVLNMPGIAIIGTREPDEDGKKAGEYFSRAFSKENFNIVSGLAIGCDTLGHRGALDSNGITTAFLAHGLDSIYPKENEDLAKEILEKGGVLLSEYRVGTSVTRYNLIARDRLQSALSLACLVIETGERGGTMHAANATLKSGKRLYVVEYKEMYSNKKRGNVRLIEQGGVGISSTDDISEIARNVKSPIRVQAEDVQLKLDLGV